MIDTEVRPRSPQLVVLSLETSMLCLSSNMFPDAACSYGSGKVALVL